VTRSHLTNVINFAPETGLLSGHATKMITFVRRSGL